MSSVFTLLLLASLVALVWGLVKPHHVARVAQKAKVTRPVTRKHSGLVFGSLIILFSILAAVTPPPQPKTQQSKLTSPNSSSPQVKGDSVTIKTDIETQPIPFTVKDENDSSLAKGQTKVVQQGKDGTKTLTYLVTYTNDTQTDKQLQSSKVTTQPVDQIVEVGTYVAPAPQPTYSAAPTTTTHSSPAPAPAPTPTPSPSPSSCYPLTNSGHCYEPGEYCRNSDHGVTGLAGDGKRITCGYNNGWRWESS